MTSATPTDAAAAPAVQSPAPVTPAQASESPAWATAAFLGWLPVIAVNAVFVSRVHVQLSTGQRLLHHLYDAGQLLGLAAASWLVVRALWLLPARARTVAGAVLVYASHYALLAGDLGSFLARHAGSSVPWHVLFAAASTLALAGCLVVGHVLSRSALRWAGVAGGILIAAGNHLVLRLDYPGTHFILAWLAASLIGSSSVGVLSLAKLPRAAEPIAVAALAVLALLSYAIVPRPVVRGALLGSSGSVAAPFVSRLWVRFQPGVDTLADGHDPVWFKSRWNLPPIPAESLPGAPPDPIVILLTVDALRGDVFEDPALARFFPTFGAMADTSLRFARAWSPAAYTMASLRALFHGTHYSQGVAREKTHGKTGDEGIHLPALLGNAGVTTVNLCTHPTYTRAKPTMAGFGEEVDLGRTAPSENVVAAVLERLDAGSSGRLFIYSHIFDPHTPYNRGGKRGSHKERYIAEISVVDKAVGTLRSELSKRKLDQRTYLIVSADHAEAFGEHGRDFHGTTVYEEMIRVPLFIEGPGVKPRRVESSASLLDVGPTVLSLFGVATPGHFMGQSLVPLMRGDDVRLTRPLAVDGGRAIRAMLFQDRWKAIVDVPHGTEELYDLKTDPGERKNLAEHPEARAYFATLHAFFAGMGATSASAQDVAQEAD